MPVVQKSSTPTQSRKTPYSTRARGLQQPSSQISSLKAPWNSLFENRSQASILLSVDFGTSTCAVGMSIVERGVTDPVDIVISNISFDGGYQSISSDIAIKLEGEPDESGRRPARLIIGSEVSEELKLGNIHEKHVFSRIKNSACFVDLTKDSFQCAKAKQEIEQLQRAHSATLNIAKHCDFIQEDAGHVSRTRGLRLKSMDDVVVCYLKMFLMQIKAAIQAKSGMSTSQVEELFEGDKESGSVGAKLRIGLAVPELWSWQRMKLCNLAIDAGFPEQLDILSESRCATAMALKKRLEKIKRQNPSQYRERLEQEANKIIMNVDKGCETLVSAWCDMVILAKLFRTSLQCGYAIPSPS